MKRSIIVAAMIAVFFAMLWGVRAFDTSSTLDDEILAYEVSENRFLNLPIYGGVDRVIVTSWLILPFSAQESAVFSYSLDVDIFDDNNRLIASKNYATRSTLHDVSPESVDFVARLADESALVAAPRGVSVSTGELSGLPGRLRIRVPKKSVDRILLRVSHQANRGGLESALVERSLNAEQRAKLTRGRSSLGFLDIPETVRRLAVGVWRRRLTALGIEGRDYTTRRLLLGDWHAELPTDSWRSMSRPLAPSEVLAHTFDGPVTLHISALPHAVLEAESPTGKTQHMADERGLLSLEFPDESIRSILFRVPVATGLAISIDAAQASKVISDEPPVIFGTRAALLSRRRVLKMYRLAPSSPVSYRLAPGQTELGLTVRALGEIAQRAHTGSVSIRWRGKDGVLSRKTETFGATVSGFERSASGSVSEPRRGRLPLVAGARFVDLYGSEQTLISINCDEPLVVTNELAPPYDGVLPPGMRWRYAPHREKRWANIRPQNERALEQAGRIERVQASERVERVEKRGSRLSPRLLRPLASVAERAVFSPTTYAPRFAWPANGWTLIKHGASRELSSLSENAGLAHYWYRASAKGLGKMWSLGAGAAALVEERALVSTGRGSFNMPGRSAILDLDGLGEEGFVLVDRPPVEPGPILKRQVFFAAEAGVSQEFSFERKAGELLSVILIITSEGGNVDLELDYRVDGGAPRISEGLLLRRLTPAGGKVRARTGARGRAQIWSSAFASGESALPDRQVGITLPLGDDLRVGLHSISVDLQASGGGDAGLWMRTVLVGSRFPERAGGEDL